MKNPNIYFFYFLTSVSFTCCYRFSLSFQLSGLYETMSFMQSIDVVIYKKLRRLLLSCILNSHAKNNCHPRKTTLIYVPPPDLTHGPILSLINFRPFVKLLQLLPNQLCLFVCFFFFADFESYAPNNPTVRKTHAVIFNPNTQNFQRTYNNNNNKLDMKEKNCPRARLDAHAIAKLAAA